MRTRRHDPRKKTHSKSNYLDFEETNSNTQISIQTPIQRAKEAIISLTDERYHSIPLCRNQEAAEIEEFVTHAIDLGGISQTLYIAGMPGVGKTLTVNSVIENLKNDKKYKNKFNFYSFNAMNYPCPSNIYKGILLKIFQESHKNSTNASALGKLNKLFTSQEHSGQHVRVVLLDELDYLMTKDQSILYNLFDWTQNNNSKLVLIAIANTLNLPEKLKQRTLSRMGDKKIAFRSYNKQEIRIIISQRLQDTTLFGSQSLRYACTKLSGFSCDIRRIIFIIGRSLKNFIDENKSEQVMISHIRDAFDETVKNRPQCMYVSSMGRDQQLILIYIMLQCQLSLRQECRLSLLCHRIHISQKYQFGKIQRCIQQFQQTGIITLRQTIQNHTAQTIVIPKIQSSDVKVSISAHQFQQLLQKINT